MKRINTETAKSIKNEVTDIIALRIKNNKFFFLGWDDSEGEEKILKPINSNGVELDTNTVMLSSLYTAITNTDEYNSAMKFHIVQGEPITTLLENMKPHTGCTKDYDIFILTQEEFHMICDSLKDGDYIFMLT